METEGYKTKLRYEIILRGIPYITISWGLDLTRFCLIMRNGHPLCSTDMFLHQERPCSSAWSRSALSHSRLETGTHCFTLESGVLNRIIT